MLRTGDQDIQSIWFRLWRRLPFAGEWTSLAGVVLIGSALIWTAGWFPGGYAGELPRDIDFLAGLAPLAFSAVGVLIGALPPPRPVVSQGRIEWRRSWVWPVGLICWVLILVIGQAENIARLPAIWEVRDWPRLAAASVLLAGLVFLLAKGVAGLLRRPVLLAIDRVGLAAPRDGIDRLNWSAVEAVVANSRTQPEGVRLVLRPGADVSGLREGWPVTDEIELTLSGAGTDARRFVRALTRFAPTVDVRGPAPGLAFPLAAADEVEPRSTLNQILRAGE